MIARSPGRARVAAFASFTLLASLGALGGCEDPSLQVVVERAPAYASQVERVEISVYERDGLTCDDIAYDKLSADELRAILRSRSDSGDLDAIPRLGHKAVVARGYGRGTRGDLEERMVIAGCAEVDEIGDDERIVIATEPVATAAIDASLIENGKGAVEIAVVAVDVNQEGIRGKEVRLTTYGPSGSFPASGDIAEPPTPAVLVSGEGQLRPMTPSMVGPYAVQVRVKWSTGLPPPVSGMMVDTPIQRSLGLPDTSFINLCTIYSRAGQPTLACLEKDSVAARFVRSYRLSGGALIQATAPVAATTAIGVFGVGTGVIVVNLDGSYTGILGASGSGSLCTGVGCAGTISDVLAFPACGASPAGLFAAVDTGAGANVELIATFLPGGEKRTFTAPPLGAITLGSAGCVTDLENSGQPQAAVTLTAGNVAVAVARSLLYLLSSGPAPALERSRERRQIGSGFTTAGKEARLLTTEFDPTGVIVVESVLNKPLTAYRLFERRRSPAVAPPRHYVSGNFDLDDEADIAWDVIDDLGDTQNRAIQMLLAARPGRPTLIGRMPLGDTADLLTADLDGDGTSELIGTTGSLTTSSVSVQRFGALSR